MHVETKVGKKLSDLTTQRVIMIVMSIMFAIPIFSLDTYLQEYTAYEAGLNTIYEFNFNKKNNLFT